VSQFRSRPMYLRVEDTTHSHTHTHAYAMLTNHNRNMKLPVKFTSRPYYMAAKYI